MFHSLKFLYPLIGRRALAGNVSSAAGGLGTGELTFYYRSGTTYASLYLQRLHRAIPCTSPALHAGIPVCDNGFLIH